jgi:signal transduction histidine kinase
MMKDRPNTGHPSLAVVAARGAVALCAVALAAGAFTALAFTRGLLTRQALDVLRESHLRSARVAAEALSEQRDVVFLGYARTWLSEGAAVEAVVVSGDGKASLHSAMGQGRPSLMGSPYPDAAWALSSTGPEDVVISDEGGWMAASCRLPPPHEDHALAARYDRTAVFRWRDRAIRGLAGRLAWAGAALLALALAGARRFGGGLAAPVLDLLMGARRLGTRLAPAPIAPRGPRELRELAGEFNALAARLGESRAALDQLLKGAAHDMRGPLSVLLAAAAELAAGAGVPAEPVRRVKMAAESLRLMVEDLLDAALTREGRGLRLAPVDAKDIVSHARDFYFGEARARGITLEAELAPGLRPVLADAAGLERVLGNLILNALRFTPSGGLILLRLEADGSRARLSVSDSGQGMEPERAARLAVGLPERGTDSSAPRHLGLGLPLCRTLVEGMGGRLGVSSAPGKGTSVVFSLPYADA